MNLLGGGAAGSFFGKIFGFSGGGVVGSSVNGGASLPAFAGGGIMNGSSYYGDKILARVNSGELIANQAQQRAIWGMMNANNDAGGDTVTFKIKGDTLVGVLNNFNRKRNVSY